METGPNNHAIQDLLSEFADDLEEFSQTPDGWDLDLRLDLAEIIVRKLQEQGLTRTNFAQRAGMKPPQLTRVLQASQNWTVNLAARLLYALGTKAKLVEVSRLGPERFYSFLGTSANGKENLPKQIEFGPTSPITPTVRYANGGQPRGTNQSYVIATSK